MPCRGKSKGDKQLNAGVNARQDCRNHSVANREVRERKQGIARHNRQRKSNADKLKLCRYSQMAVAFPNA